MLIAYLLVHASACRFRQHLCRTRWNSRSCNLHRMLPCWHSDESECEINASKRIDNFVSGHVWQRPMATNLKQETNKHFTYDVIIWFVPFVWHSARYVCSVYRVIDTDSLWCGKYWPTGTNCTISFGSLSNEKICRRRRCRWHGYSATRRSFREMIIFSRCANEWKFEISVLALN